MVKKASIKHLLSHPNYTPNRLLNRVGEILNARNDSAIAKRLGVDSAMILRVRDRTYQISSNMMIAIMDETNLSLKEIRDLAGLAHKSRGTSPIPIQSHVEPKIEPAEEKQ